jgi:hypothetical protein
MHIVVGSPVSESEAKEDGMAERDHATYTATSLTSMDDALNNAWNQVPGGEAEVSAPRTLLACG